MQIFTWLFAVFFLASCKETREKRNDLRIKHLIEKPIVDSGFKLKTLYENTYLTKTKVVTLADTMFFLQAQGATYMVDKIFFDFKKADVTDLKRYYYIPDDQVKSDLLNKAEKLSLGLVDNDNRFPSFDRNSIDEADIKKLIPVEAKITRFKNTYFFIDTLVPKKLYWLDAKTRVLHSFDVSGRFFEVRRFFSFDLNADGCPELFISTAGVAPREDVLTCSVLSIIN